MRKGKPTLGLTPLSTTMAEQGAAPDIADGQSQTPLAVAACRLGDIRGLRSLDEIQVFHQPEALLTPYSALRHGLESISPVPRDRPHVFVARSEQGVVGFADFQPVLPDRRWHLAAVGTSRAAPHQMVLESLLRHGIGAAGAQGVKRLYARLRPEFDVSDVAHSLGFSPYAEEIVFARRSSDDPRGHGGTRVQEQPDTWAIHQLYNATVPREVQYAEAFTSHCWDVNVRRAIAPGAIHGRVLEDGHQIVGYIRVSSRAGTHVIELMVAPTYPNAAGRLLDDALAEIQPRGDDRVFCAIRTYQQHLRKPLEDRGFDAVWTQHLHVKYTTVTVRTPVSEAIVFQTDVRERAPTRVPTFLQRSERDESAPISR